MITKEQLEAIIKAVDEGGDNNEISEEEVIAILLPHKRGTAGHPSHPLYNLCK